MKTRAKRAEERLKFLEKLNNRPKKTRNYVGDIERLSCAGNKASPLKIKISRDQIGAFAIQNFSIDDELPALIKQEPIDDEYEVGQNKAANQVKKDNFEKKSVATQCHSNHNELWLYVGRNEKKTANAQTQTSPFYDENGFCNPDCQFLLFGRYCGPLCQFIRLMIQ